MGNLWTNTVKLMGTPWASTKTSQEPRGRPVGEPREIHGRPMGQNYDPSVTLGRSMGQCFGPTEGPRVTHG